MAKLIQAYTEEEMRKLGVANVRIAYEKLAKDYNRILNMDVIQCQKCGDWLEASAFYTDNRFISGKFYKCKKCVQKEVEQRKTEKDEPNETIESVQKVLREMDRPYLDDLYKSCLKASEEKLGEKYHHSTWASYVTALLGLHQYNKLHWNDSDFGKEVPKNENQEEVDNEIISKSIKRFGSDYTNKDYMFLENEYQDWVTRYECNTKAQEEIFKSLSMNRLERKWAVRDGKPTKEIDKTFQELLATNNIQPRQTSTDALSEAQTLGTLLQKYEETRPLPEIDPELQDVDKIGLYIDSFFKGHTAKMLGIKNTFTNIYEKVMSKFTVTRPEYDEEEDSEVLFEKIFGQTSNEE